MIRIEPLSVHRVIFRPEPPSTSCGCAPFFSLTQISISAKRKHSNSCHDWRSLPTRIVPCNRSLPNLVMLELSFSGCLDAHLENSKPCQLSTRTRSSSVISSSTSGGSYDISLGCRLDGDFIAKSCSWVVGGIGGPCRKSSGSGCHFPSGTSMVTRHVKLCC